ncbi:MAG: universal stress protein [Desulfovibrionaceae bacterium]
MLPRINSILYATDLSENSRHALWYAASLGRQYNAAVTLLHVVPDMAGLLGYPTGQGISVQNDDADWIAFTATAGRKATHSALENLRAIVRDCAEYLDFNPLSEERILVVEGQPAERILALVHAGNFDLLVLGTRGQGGPLDVMMGSVAQRVVRRSQVPVLTVRLPAPRTH